jgi:AAA15 family ATPase/GTPase
VDSERGGLPIIGLSVDGFRALTDVTVQPAGPAPVVCGPNNVGKSSLLEMLGEFSDITPGIQTGRLWDEGDAGG